MLKRAVLFYLLAQASFIGASSGDSVDDTELVQADKVTIASLHSNGQILRTGVGFLYDATTIVCSYADVKGAAQIRIQWNGTSTQTDRLVSFNESMDLAVFVVQEEIPVVTPIGSSSTLARGDKVAYWTEVRGRWERTGGVVYEILDTGKGYDLILVESGNYSTRSTPLYNTDGKIVGWLQGKRAIPMNTIASFAEKQTGPIAMAEMSRQDLFWKFSKPSRVDSRTHFSFSKMKTVNGPASFSFKVNLPEDWPTQVWDRSGRFHIRYEQSGICVEVRVTPLGDNDLMTALAHAESLVFTDFLRAEMIPYSTDYLTGFRTYYEDSDPTNPYILKVFYTSSSQNLYLLSISFPKRMEDDLKPFVEQIFSSFRM